MGAITAALLGYNAQTGDRATRYFFPEHYIGSKSGQTVNETTARSVSTFHACVKAISEDLAKLPLQLFERTDERSKEKAINHPLYATLHGDPNPWQTHFQWVEMMVAHALYRGNAFSEIVRANRRINLVPRHPMRIQVIEHDDGSADYVYTQKAGEKPRLIPGENMWHLPAYSDQGRVGESVIQHMKESLGLALSMESFAANFQKNQLTAAHVMSMPGSLSKEQENRLQQSMAVYRGADEAGKTMFLENDLKPVRLGITLEEAQFIESRNMQAVDIARFFRMPPHKIQLVVGAVGGASDEHRAIEYVQDTLMPWAVRFEQACDRDLIKQRNRFFTKIVLAGLMRGDSKSRSEFYRSGITAGYMTRNQARELEDWNPLDGLDEPLEPLNMASAGDTDETEERGGDQDEGLPGPRVPNGAAVPEQVRATLIGVCEKFVRQEIRWVEKNGTGNTAALEDFYAKHVGRLTKALNSAEAAKTYCDARCAELIKCGPKIVDTWASDKPAELYALAFETEGI